jgi:hypothetical protein
MGHYPTPAKHVVGAKAISDETVREKTGKDWKEWFTILDKKNMVTMGHMLMVKYLREKENVSPWWAQAIVLRYEHDRGIKKNNREDYF